MSRARHNAREGPPGPRAGRPSEPDGQAPQTPRSTLRHIVRSSPDARAVLTRWRDLTARGARDKERPTLVACSAGADSCALAIVLAASGARIVLGHIRHDLRPSAETALDAEHVRTLAQALGAGFALAEVRVPRDRGNIEQAARRARYVALAELAESAQCPFIATAHHAGDQLETVLMRLMRGSGPRGLAGIPPKRLLRTGSGALLTIVRPMLAAPRSFSRGICTALPTPWREDPTNLDRGPVRNELRARVTPEIERMCPTIAARLDATCASLRAAADLIAGEAQHLLLHANEPAPGRAELPTAMLLRAVPAVRAEAIRLLYYRATGLRGDRLPARTVDRIAAAILAQPSHPREFAIRSARVRMSARSVGIERTTPIVPRTEPESSANASPRPRPSPRSDPPRG